MLRLRAAKYHPIACVAHGTRPRTYGVVIHTIEGSHDGAISWFSNPGAGGCGAHVVFGTRPGEVTQLCDLNAICWHAPGANYDRIGFEHEGYASYRREDWLTPARKSMLKRSANRTAWVCWKYGLGRPRRRVNVHGHVDFPAGGHHDPGEGFPWKRYMRWANAAYFALKLTNGKAWTKR